MAFGGVGGSAATVGDSPVYRRFLGCAAVDVYRIFHSGLLRICLGGMAISECPSRETYLAADISLIVENRGVTTDELGFRFTRGCEVGIMANPSSAHLISGLLRPAA